MCVVLSAIARQRADAADRRRGATEYPQHNLPIAWDQQQHGERVENRSCVHYCDDFSGPFVVDFHQREDGQDSARNEENNNREQGLKDKVSVGKIMGTM
uniref:Secreted protein n=1 Tax=Bursaphelenchus xylophilus TaxID=6326 RepID=A0A1I7RMI2_BURXY